VKLSTELNGYSIVESVFSCNAVISYPQAYIPFTLPKPSTLDPRCYGRNSTPIRNLAM